MLYYSQMEIVNFDELQVNPANPRAISKKQVDDLKDSLLRFGDLSGIVRNLTTGNLVGGNQRTNIFRMLSGEKRVVISQRYEAPNRQGTVAIGWVELDGEMYAYREVEWDKGTETAANVAANHMGGSDDDELLARATYDLSQLENGDELMQSMGLSERKINNLLASVGVGDGDDANEDDQADDAEKPDKLEFALTRDQRLIIERAIEVIKSTRDLQAIETASTNGSALFVMAQDYLALHENDVSQNVAAPGELTDIPA